MIDQTALTALRSTADDYPTAPQVKHSATGGNRPALRNVREIERPQPNVAKRVRWVIRKELRQIALGDKLGDLGGWCRSATCRDHGGRPSADPGGGYGVATTARAGVHTAAGSHALRTE